MNPDASSVLPERKSFYHRAATFCLWLPLVGCVLSVSYWPLYRANHLPQSQAGAIVDVAFKEAALVLGVLGCVFGLFALFGLRHYGPKRILAKVTAGFLIFLLTGIVPLFSIRCDLVEIAWRPPAKLAQQILDADRVIVLHAGSDPTSMTGEEARKIVKAVSSARWDTHAYSCTFNSHIEFCKGTNSLATISWCGRLFLTDAGQFSDNSGALKELYNKSM